MGNWANSTKEIKPVDEPVDVVLLLLLCFCLSFLYLAM